MFGNSPPLIVTQACEPKQPVPRLSKLLDWLGIACSSWHARPAAKPGRPGRKPKGVPEKLAARIRTLAETYHWWGYKKIAVVAGREGLKVTNKQVYRAICTACSSLPSNCWISCARAVASKSDLFGFFHLPEDISSITLHRVQRDRVIQIQRFES
jgi:hypothetical protein